MQPVLALLILAFPAAGAVLLSITGWRRPRFWTQVIGPGVVWAAFACTTILFAGQLAGQPAMDHSYWTWIRTGAFYVPFNLIVDHLSMFMAMVVSGVGALIITYSLGYMEHESDAGYARFFAYMDLFILSMLLLVLAGNFVFLIVGWAAVGLSSYLLIGFWYDRPAAVVAARKAFVMNVIGDVGMILATFIIWVHFHSVLFSQVFHAFPKQDGGFQEAIGFLLLLGALAKSAQLPLHTWLPDAMEGPTPVSALIHAATMVTAGVYLIGRMHVIYGTAYYSHTTAAVIGAATALFAASIAIVQTDIKKVLAYSTMSQIGYMFLAVGIGAYAAGFFHLLAHAFFKALLFMAAGNVIHAMRDEQDMRRFGGLLREMPKTAWCFLAGSLALAGIIPFVGFWSKEAVLGDVFSRGLDISYALWAVGFLTALLTGFYTGRMWWIAFVRPAAPDRPVDHPHEARWVMLGPVAVLAVLATVGGFVQINAGFHNGWKLVEDFLAPTVGSLGWQARGFEYVPTAATVLLSGVTFWLAYYLYVQVRAGWWRPERWRTRFGWAQRTLERKYYFDEIYDAAFVRPLDRAAGGSERWVDTPLIDGAVNGVGTVTESSAGSLSLTQSGYFRNYVLVFTAGAVLAVIIILARSLG
ncbi:MAG: NADH-quinone oxidoreductase subunit L [Candidatus Dormibacteraceae bacterium]